MIQQLELAAGLARGDAAEARLDKLEALLAPTATGPREAVRRSSRTLLGDRRRRTATRRRT